ncbi:class I SAM-dependent methyltransferase [Rhodococcus triatomae]|nr:type 11 methyltransferase [Rhodococcus triatomae BKS 15-14]
MIADTEQARAWNGYEGGHWAAHHDRYDLVNSGFNDHLLHEVAPGDEVLDVGCGNGQVLRSAARRGAHATGIDLSEPMLERARATAVAEKVHNVTLIRGDAQLFAFEEGEFDVALSRFGVMFFADPVAAFANIARALRPGGRLAFVCMTDAHDDDLATVLRAVSGVLDWQPGHRHTGPNSLADPSHIRRALSMFRQVRIEKITAEQVWGRDADDAARFLGGWGPVRHALRDADASDAAHVHAALVDAMRRYEKPDAVRLRGTAWLVRAVRP